MAPASEYVSGGGKLKIKGAPVLEGRVGKKGKKKRKKEREGGGGGNEEVRMKSVEGEGEGARTPVGAGSGVDGSGGRSRSRSGSRSQSRGVSEGVERVVVGKTEAERRYEEARRKRLDERLKREGVKTHKERVEELNKYLSNLSEHHDMYVRSLSIPFSGEPSPHQCHHLAPVPLTVVLWQSRTDMLCIYA
ncbi:hypothetical protein EMPG_11665 [Blastomyces silverae]|uniref:DUF1754-domain-containing protein n=1 Tax=Blastomyces silverae TaxID=2060906 RepID=A0A0H1BQN6_9EURO|nr:hypothetical protein EMPG_11665 [Blastomyces silverae]